MKYDRPNLHPFAKRVYEANRRAKKINAQGRFTVRTIIYLYEKQKGKCACCGQLLQGLFEIDHIIPLSKGGKNDVSNLQLLTPKCNKIKSDSYQIKCFRHQLYPTDRRCWLCDAKTEANGCFEYARKLFIWRF